MSSLSGFPALNICFCSDPPNRVFVDRTARMLMECFPTCHRREHHDIVMLRLDAQALVRSACSNLVALRPPVFGMRSTILRVIVSAVPKPGEIREAENILGAT